MADREILTEWVDAFNSENIEAIMELYADTAALCLVAKYPLIGIGRNSIRKIYRWLFSSGERTFSLSNSKELRKERGCTRRLYPKGDVEHPKNIIRSLIILLFRLIGIKV